MLNLLRASKENRLNLTVISQYSGYCLFFILIDKLYLVFYADIQDV